MINLRDALLAIASSYENEVSAHGGRSLARIATIVVNRGAFFERLRAGKTCTLETFQALICWFALADNWPGNSIPVHTIGLMAPFQSVTEGA